MSDISVIKDLLEKVESQLTHAEQLTVLKGENFNIFSILRMESKENQTHSAFLNELLSPKGSHNMQDAFLKLFISELGNIKHNKETQDFLTNFKTKDATTTVEFYIGPKDVEKKMGGRLDILIRDSKKDNIIIENKIYAVDQEAQIERYCNFEPDKSKILYLTLHGGPASEMSSGDLRVNKDYFPISYRKTILNWLLRCQNEASDHPILRESIKQYIILIKKLTGQLTDSIMKNEIKQVLKSNIKCAFKVADLLDNLIPEILEDFQMELMKKTLFSLSKEVAEKVTLDKNCITIGHISNKEELHFACEWDGYDFFYGFQIADNNQNNAPKYDKYLPDSQEFNDRNEYWLGAKFPSGAISLLQKMDREEAITLLCNGAEKAKAIQLIIEESLPSIMKLYDLLQGVPQEH